jgi:hypothetical protein
MGAFTTLLATVFRDYITDGVPGSGIKQPTKADIRSIGVSLDGLLPKAGGVSDAMTGVLVVGTSLTPAASNVPGFSASPTAGFQSHGGSTYAANLGRTGDGSLVRFLTDTSLAGVIASTGGVVTYGSFCGAHWSQHVDGGRPEILPGTIVETVDAMCVFLAVRFTDHDGRDRLEEIVSDSRAAGDEVLHRYLDESGEEPVERTARAVVVALDNPQLPKFTVSGESCSRSVYGVFIGWDEDGDAQIAALGAYVVRVASGVTVARGDLLESDGAGCARLQADDVVRSSTLAKVTAAVPIETYPDGSFLVPAVLLAG